MEDVAVPISRPLPRRIQRLRMSGLVCLLTVLLITAVGAYPAEYLAYVGTYTGKGSEGIYAYRFDPATGVAQPVGLVAATDNPSFLAADPKGRFLYVSNRGHDSIAVFSIHPGDGSLTALEWVPSGGKAPRHFVIDPTGEWLFAANQGSDNISLLRIDPKSGRLTPTDRSLAVISPVCIEVAKLYHFDSDRLFRRNGATPSDRTSPTRDD